jgi:hypothetical protein
MFHQIFDKRPWFASKQYGYGAGLPITWQGWALTLSYVGVMIGAGLLASRGGAGPRGAMIVLMLVASVVFVAIAYRRTAGGWRWRWGKTD